MCLIGGLSPDHLPLFSII